MFERFTREAKETVNAAVVEAKRARAPKVGEQHLLLALMARDPRVATILADADVTRDKIVAAYRDAQRRAGLTDAEAAALRDLGIDVDEVVRRVENAHGENVLAGPRRRAGHLGFHDEAKRVLELALREARDRNQRELRGEHILLAMAARGDIAAQVLEASGLGYPELRAKAS